MKASVKCALAIVAAVASSQVISMANGTSAPPPPSMGSTPVRPLTPEERANEVYNSGIEHRDRGNKHEKEAVNAKKPEDRTKSEAKSRGEYEKALKDFEKATNFSSAHFAAYNGMGYSYRKLGDYQKALEMYDKALQLAPGFSDAVEYRGEAYLGLSRIDDAKQAYLELIGLNRKNADLLMTAMRAWVAARRAEPAGVDAATLDAFESWIKERAGLAQQTASMSLASSHRGSW
ncbi:MAG: tetratricopeptide repeat protein [Vicinamibacterales bacterium]